MKNLNKPLAAILAAITVFSVFSVLVALGTVWERNSSSPSPPIRPITSDCGCYCHKLHEKEETQMLAQIREDRALLLEEKSRISEDLMKKQYEECSKPFRDFLEEISQDEK